MRHFRATVVTASILVLIVSWPGYSAAQDSPASKVPEGNLSIMGTITNVEGSPIKGGKVTITSGPIVREAISDKKGEFRIKDLSSKTGDVAYVAPGYEPLVERSVALADGMNLSETLQEEVPDSRWALLLLLPGLVGLSYCAWDSRKNKKKREIGQKQQIDNHYFVAMLGGWLWATTLFILVFPGGFGSVPQNSLYLFHLNLPMEIYVPAFGFVGALLFVLEIRRRYGREEPNGREGPTRNSKERGEGVPKPIEDIPKGKEFGMRIIMGPYVAIVVVGLLAKDLTSPAARGALAFFSGLLVVMFLQWLVEEGQRTLGKLRIDSDRRNLDERKWQLEKDMGNLVWARLREKGVNTVPEFGLLDDSALDKVAAGDLPLLKNDLISLRDRARELAIAS